jgi:hypothetical protein
MQETVNVVDGYIKVVKALCVAAKVRSWIAQNGGLARA